MTKLTINQIKQIVKTHDDYWDTLREEMRRYKSAYECRIWDDDDGEEPTDFMVRLSTSEGYSTIESYQASLFAKNPAVIMKAGLKNKGDIDKSKLIANDFLLRARKEVENASRIALIYPSAFIKVIPTDSEDIYSCVTSVPLAPWDVIVDMDAVRWSEQHFVGHTYWMTKQEATEKFGAKKYDCQRKVDFFKSGKTLDVQTNYEDDEDQVYDYIRVVEVYDLVNDLLYWWSPNWANGDKLLDSTNKIPFRDVYDDPVVPISPLYYNYIPDRPLVGYSALSRSYDRLLELSIIRTFQANAVRRSSRQWLLAKGKLDEDQKAALFAGIDGLAVEVELKDNETLRSIMLPVPHTEVPRELQQYYSQIMSDKDKGSILAPFTRGEATNASATESSALIFYNSSEIGRLSRERDAMIEQLAHVYLCVMALYVEEARDNKSNTMVYPGKSLVSILPEDLLGDFQIFASDTSSTPLNELVKKQEFFQNVDFLLKLGVSQKKIKEYAIELLQLPEDFLEEEVPAVQQSAQLPPDKTQMQPEMTQALEQAAMSPGPSNVPGLMLPGNGLENL